MSILDIKLWYRDMKWHRSYSYIPINIGHHRLIHTRITVLEVQNPIRTDTVIQSVMTNIQNPDLEQLLALKAEGYL